jgi:hypothetical protein
MDDPFEDSPPELPGAIAMPVAHIKVHAEPRISAKQLAEYLVSDQSRQRAIIKESKFAKTVMVVPYKKVRSSIPHAFSRDCLDIDSLGKRANEIEMENNQPDVSQWFQKDNTNSAAALRHLCSIAPNLTWKNARVLHLRFPALVIAGVTVSVCPEVAFSFEHKQIAKVGGIILNTAQSEDKSLARDNGSFQMGQYLAALLFNMLLAHASKIGVPLHTHCYAVDIFRESVYTAPPGYRRLNKNIEAACEFIASLWPKIEYRTSVPDAK